MGQVRVYPVEPRPFSFFNLFYPPQQVMPDYVRPQRQPPAQRPSEPTRPTRGSTEQPKPLAKRHFAVIGDGWAEWVSYGLTHMFADNPDIAILDRSRGLAGVARTDSGEFIKLTGEMLAKDAKIDGLVVMVGGADRFAPIKRDGATLEAGSNAWRQGFSERLEVIATSLKARGLPIVWVGLPPVRGTKAMADYAVINALIKEQAEKHGIAFVDVWTVFLDEKGAFAASGPDVNGQIRRLRHGDGFHFTSAGGRKLGFFVEQEVRRTLMAGVAPPPVDLPLPPFMGILPEGERQAPDARREKPAIGPNVVLTGAGGNAIVPQGSVTLDGAARPKTGHGMVPPSHAKGHAMDFRWPSSPTKPE